MFASFKNLYLQLSINTNPRLLDHSVREAHDYVKGDLKDEIVPLQKLTSAQPSLYAPCADITRARLGWKKIGLKILVRQLHHDDALIQLQAMHTLLDQVQLPESAYCLIEYRCVYRLVDLLLHDNPVIREKACLILTHVAKYYQGVEAILSRMQILKNLLYLILKDEKKEIRYAAAYTLKTVSQDRCKAEIVSLTPDILPHLLCTIKQEYTGIVLLHLKTLENLFEWDPVEALKYNAFEIILALFCNSDYRVIVGGLDCMRQLLKNEKAKTMADERDMVFVLQWLLDHEEFEVVLSAAMTMEYATLTRRSRWRAKERHVSLLTKLVDLSHIFNQPNLQLVCMRVLINLCDMPDMRAYAKVKLQSRIKDIKIRTHEQWDGTSETTSYAVETGHRYRTMCIEDMETIKNDGGEDARAVNVHSYLRTVRDVKEQLIKAINWLPY